MIVPEGSTRPLDKPYQAVSPRRLEIAVPWCAVLRYEEQVDSFVRDPHRYQMTFPIDLSGYQASLPQPDPVTALLVRVEARRVCGPSQEQPEQTAPDSDGLYLTQLVQPAFLVSTLLGSFCGCRLPM